MCKNVANLLLKKFAGKMETAIFVPKVNGFFGWGFREESTMVFHNHVVTFTERKISNLMKISVLR